MQQSKPMPRSSALEGSGTAVVTIRVHPGTPSGTNVPAWFTGPAPKKSCATSVNPPHAGLKNVSINTSELSGSLMVAPEIAHPLGGVVEKKLVKLVVLLMKLGVDTDQLNAPTVVPVASNV